MQNDIDATLNRLIALLEEWADWQRGYNAVRGYSTRTPGTNNGHASKSFDDLYDTMAAERCRIIDGAIDDLPPAKKAAICKCYGIAAVFRFPRENYEQCLMDAHEALMAILPSKGVIV